MRLEFFVFLAVKVASDSWEDICHDHPFAAHRKSGKFDTFDPKNTSSDGATLKCTIEFDFDYPESMADKFCLSRFYAPLHSRNIKKSEKMIECVYEKSTFCDDPNDLNIYGDCFKLMPGYETLDEAKRKCAADHAMFLTQADQTAVEWILKIHDPNSEEILPAVWFDSHMDEFDEKDIWQYSEQDPSKTASILQFRYNFPVPFSYIQPAHSHEKHRFYCKKSGKKFPSAFRRYCEIVHKEFKIPAAYHRSTCFMMSMSVHRPKFINNEIDNTHYNDECDYVENMKTYAVAPTSRVKFDGMVKAVLSSYPLDPLQTPRIVTPGQSTDKTAALHYSCKSNNRDWLNKFYYIGSDGKKYDVATSNWDARSLRRECADLHRDVIVLAPWSGDKLEGYHPPPNEDSILTTYDYPRFFRGHKVCAAGFKKEDIYSTKCAAGWSGIPRDDGTMTCHKAITQGVYLESKNTIEKVCKDQGGEFLAGIESAAEQKLVYDLMYAQLKSVNMQSTHGSIMIGMVTDRKGFTFRQDHDNSLVYYSNWEAGGPSFWGDYEFCAVMVFNPFDGRWNDQNCDATTLGHGKYKIIGAICSKRAE